MATKTELKAALSRLAEPQRHGSVISLVRALEKDIDEALERGATWDAVAHVLGVSRGSFGSAWSRQKKKAPTKTKPRVPARLKNADYRRLVASIRDDLGAGVKVVASLRNRWPSLAPALESRLVVVRELAEDINRPEGGVQAAVTRIKREMRGE